jgi:hypothetical protein
MADTDTNSIEGILERHAATAAQDLKTQEDLRTPETALKASNTQKVNSLLGTAQNITNRASPVTFNLNPQNPSATIGWSTNNGLGNNGTNFGIAATASGNGTGVNAAVTTPVGNGTLGAMVGTNGASVVFKTNEAPPSTFDPASIGRQVNSTVEAFKASQQNKAVDIATLNNVFGVQR